MSNPLDHFGCMVFGDRTMKERLPKDVYKALKKTMEQGKRLDPSLADVVANAMKDWAVEKGVTHYTHWFHPMTGITAEKHDSFLTPDRDGGIIMEFSGKELIRGEPDASSFPSGGLRATFEARGYTAWDPTSYAFIKEGTLCIPTAFCSYSGDSLDKKTPLLRSMEAINRQSMRVLRALGDQQTRHVSATVGPEQEYFLVDAKLARKRRDLMYCGRTLFGARPPKGQEMDDHYFGSIKPRVKAFMDELNQELWQLGILAKTEHNEAAPAQHELAPVYSTVNISTDHNQLTMEMMRKVASRHGLLCLLHEKPFAGVNGSGKHNNWSLSTDQGENLLEPGEKPEENLRFLVFLTATLKAVDDYPDMLRITVATAGNDCRLGGDEAPPAILSVFLGDDIATSLECVESGKPFGEHVMLQMKSGVKTQPAFMKDNTDRNRTSPFAFTGNKFEFRMPGSSLSIAGPNFVLNTMVAEELRQFADQMETFQDVEAETRQMVRKAITEHKRIIFNGNNYAAEWVEEAEKRGLLNLRTAMDALPHFVSEKNVHLFTSHGILTETEVYSRMEILMENYNKSIHIEAMTMAEMARREITPAVIRYLGDVSGAVARKASVCPEAVSTAEKELIVRLSELLAQLGERCKELEQAVSQAEAAEDAQKKGECYRDLVAPKMASLRAVADEMEPLVGEKDWPFPVYGDLLFRI